MKLSAMIGFVVALYVTVTIPAALAQQQLTVGDLLSKGAKKLTKDEVQKVVNGATVSGTQVGKPEITFQNKYMPDGTVAGDGWRNGTYFGKIAGRWWISDLGQFCNYLQNGGVQSCNYYFGFSSQFYAAKSDATTELVYERKVSR